LAGKYSKPGKKLVPTQVEIGGGMVRDEERIVDVSVPASVIYEGNSQQGNTYQTTFNHLHPEVPLIRHYTTQANKFDTGMGLTVLKTLVRKERLRIAPEVMETEGAERLLEEIRDLGTPAHDHIACALWFIIRLRYEQTRYKSRKTAIRSGYQPRVRAQYRPARMPAYRSFSGR
jgi:hypothetical protein